MTKKGVYIHIPFCKSICSYCDFCKVLYNEHWVYDYLRVLKDEIEDIYMGEEIDSIYIGGGTPSSLSVKALNYLLNLIKKFNIKDLKEFTFECNLNDLNEELLLQLKEAKVNRLSIGIESFNQEKLKYMGRNHNFKDAVAKINLCRTLGFNNINIDFIYGFSFEDVKSVKKDLLTLLKLNPEHISTYSLMIEDNTLLKIRNIPRIDDDTDALMYEEIKKILKKYHYQHYEVSNFCKEGYESYHNLKYWHNLEYYGFGLSASGYIDKIRYTNTYSLTKYIKGNFEKEKIILTKKDIMDNHLMLGFRLMEGINVLEFEQTYHERIDKCYPINPLLKNGDLILKKGNIFINPDKIYIMNEILLKMI